MTKLQSLRALDDFTGYAFVRTNSRDTSECAVFEDLNKTDLINAALLISKYGKLELVKGTIRFYDGEVRRKDTRNYEIIGSINNGIIKLNPGWKFNE